MIQALDRIVYRLNDKLGEKFGKETWFQHARAYALTDLVIGQNGCMPTFYNPGTASFFEVDVRDRNFSFSVYHRCLKTQLDTNKGGGQSWHQTAVSDILSVVHFDKGRLPYTPTDMVIMLNDIWDGAFDANDLYISGMMKVDCNLKDVNMDMFDIYETEYQKICPLSADNALFAIKTQILAKVDPFNNGSWSVSPLQNVGGDV